MIGANETKKNRIAKFGYNRIFGYSGHPKKTEFGNIRPKPFGSLAKTWNLF
jgi:hypothetical protein